MSRLRLFAALSVLLAAAALFGQSAMPELSRDAVGVKPFPAAPRLAERASIAPAAVLGPVDAAQIEEIHVANAQGANPARNGFTRGFAELIAVRLDAAVSAKRGPRPQAGGVIAASERGIVWSGSFRVEGAYRVRLHLEHAKLPGGAVLWVYGDGDAPVAFDRELVDADGSLWTPSVRGGNVHLEIEIASPKSDADVASFEVREVMQLVAPRVVTKPDDAPTCLIDVTCVTDATLPNVNLFSRAIAHLEFVKGSGSFVCSGGLLNDFDTSTFIPFLLTANHCFDAQSSATSLEAFWDWRFSSCVSTVIPDPSTFPRSNGAALLASSSSSDFTLVRFGSVPANRLFFGWNPNTSAIPNGTTLHRISHPFPEDVGVLPQMYSNTQVDTSFSACSGKGRPNFIYSTGGQGGVYGGSSGSPVILANGQVVGQLLGSCGPDPAAGCDPRNATVDGAFSTTYPQARQFLEGTSTVNPCIPSATKVCLNNDRFAISVTWRTRDNQTGDGRAIKYTADSALFWFFADTNIEMLVKVLNGCGLNNRYWVFSAATTDVEYTVTATDTKTGGVKTYFHPLGTPAPAVTDTGAFATCP